MLTRLLEPEVMDTVEEAIDYNTMDHSAVNRVFVDDFLAVWNHQGPILDLGTGTALIPIELCGRTPRAQVVGIDLAEEMLKLGRQNIEKTGFADRIRLELTDAKRIPYPDRSFAAVMSNSIIHHIPEPATVFAEIVRVTTPQATIFLRDLLRPSDESTLQQLVETYAKGANAHQRKLFGDSLRAALTVAEVQSMVAAIGFDPEGVRQTSDRHWTWVVA